MSDPRHIAQLNIGRLVADTDDPRVAAFMENLDRINDLGKRMPGFVWMMEGSGAPGTGNTDAKIAGDPRFIANLTVWENAGALQAFVFDTVHRQFYERRGEWFEAMADRHFVMWPIPVGHRPTLEEGLARLDQLKADGPGDEAFDWTYLNETTAARAMACAPVAAE